VVALLLAVSALFLPGGMANTFACGGNQGS
jgi:hypothetical protein